MFDFHANENIIVFILLCFVLSCTRCVDYFQTLNLYVKILFVNDLQSVSRVHISERIT